MRCGDCGRFMRWDAPYSRWWCDACEHGVPQAPPVVLPPDWHNEGIGRVLVEDEMATKVEKRNQRERNDLVLDYIQQWDVLNPETRKPLVEWIAFKFGVSCEVAAEKIAEARKAER